MTRDRHTAVQRIVDAVEAISGLRVPIAPRVLAQLLGREVVPVIGAQRVRPFSARSRRLYRDALQPSAAHRAIALGCAAYIRHHYGAAGRGVAIAELALALCGHH